MVSPCSGWACITPLPNATVTSSRVVFGGWRLKQGRPAIAIPSVIQPPVSRYFGAGRDEEKQPITFAGLSASHPSSPSPTSSPGWDHPYPMQDGIPISQRPSTPGSWGLKRDGMRARKLPLLNTGCSADFVFQNR